MANSYELLTAAGAPAIVEPLFYRIHEDYVSKNIVVEIRERRPYKGSNLKAKASVRPGLASVMASRVAEAALEAYERMNYEATLASLTGVASSEGRDDV